MNSMEVYKSTNNQIESINRQIESTKFIFEEFI